jgi:hypothetical protein
VAGGVWLTRRCGRPVEQALPGAYPPVYLCTGNQGDIAGAGYFRFCAGDRIRSISISYRTGPSPGFKGLAK